ncbi:MAG TPA: hypothetical protein VFT46_02730 [Holophagaceae bacterium]|nr:hypothetical protein [Holophagaceae bacterium]
MLKLAQITDLDRLARQPFDPPPGFVGAVEEAAARGEPWRAIQALPEGALEPGWLLIFPDREEDLYFLEGETFQGRWDEAQQVFLADEGPPLDLLGRRVSLESVVAEREEEDAAWEEDRERRKAPREPIGPL